METPEQREKRLTRQRKYKAKLREQKTGSPEPRKPMTPEERAAADKSASAKYRANNRERERERSRQYYASNKEKHSEAVKAWQAKNPEVRKAIAKRYRDANKGKHYSRCKRWLQANPERNRQYAKNRKARKREVNENFTASMKNRIAEQFSHSCANCGSPYDLFVDHHLPLSLGYRLEYGNAVLLCLNCNSAKRNKLPQNFYTEAKLLWIQLMLLEQLDW